MSAAVARAARRYTRQDCTKVRRGERAEVDVFEQKREVGSCDLSGSDHFPQRLASPSCTEMQVNARRGKRNVAHPVLHIDPIKFTLSHVHRDRMPERMDVLPIGWQPCCLRVLAEGMGDERCRNGLSGSLSARKQVTRPGGTWLPKVVLEQTLC